MSSTQSNPLQSLKVKDILYCSQRYRIQALDRDKAIFPARDDKVYEDPTLETAP